MPEKTGYELSYEDFERLLTDANDRLAIAPLLKHWFGVQVEAVEEGKNVRVLSAAGIELDISSLYERIQANREMQYDLYQAAMNLWR